MYDSDERDVTILKAILPLMSRHAAGYHPISYSVWHDYAKGTNAGLRQAVDEALESRERLTPSLTYALYSRYLVHPAEQALLSARSDLLDLVARVQLAVRHADTDVAGFDAQLSQFHLGLSEAKSLEELGASVHAMVEHTSKASAGLGRLVGTLEQSQEEVRRLTDDLHRLRREAVTDALSGLLNRRGMESELARIAQDYAGQGAGAGVLVAIMFDIDHFKKVNDTYGHRLGDAVISAVGGLIRSTVGERGIAARYGGEEFAVLLPRHDVSVAQELAELVRRGVEQGKIRQGQGAEAIGGITISAGVARGCLNQDAYELLNRADQALYSSKREGRNRVTVAA